MSTPVLEFIRHHNSTIGLKQLAPGLFDYLTKLPPIIDRLFDSTLHEDFEERLRKYDWDLISSIGYVVSNRVYDYKFSNEDRDRAFRILTSKRHLAPEVRLFECYLQEYYR